jgi:hypothetical protein
MQRVPGGSNGKIPGQRVAKVGADAPAALMGWQRVKGSQPGSVDAAAFGGMVCGALHGEREHPFVRLIAHLARWFALTGACLLAAMAQPTATGGGRLLLALELDDPADTLSAVKSWPVSADVRTEPSDAAAETAIAEVLAASRTAAATTGALQPGLPGEDFVNQLQEMLRPRGFEFPAGFDLPEGAPPGRAFFAMGYTFAPAEEAAVSPCCFEIWVRTDLLPAGAAAQRWSLRELAAEPGVATVLREQRGGTAPAAIPADTSLVVLSSEGIWLRNEIVNNPAFDSRFAPIAAVAVAAAEAAHRARVLETPRQPANRPGLEDTIRAGYSGWRLTGEVAFADELSAVEDAYGQPGKPAWVLRVTGFDPVRRQTILVDEVQLGAVVRQPWAAFVERQAEAGFSVDALEVQRDRLRDRLERTLERAQPWSDPHFALPSDHDARVALLRGEAGVAAVEPRVFRGEVAYAVVWQPVLTTLEVSGNYGSDRGGQASARLGVQTRAGSVGLEAFVGDRRSGAFFDASSMPRAIELPDNATATWSLLGETTREEPVFVGTPPRFRITEHASRAAVRWRVDGGRSAETQQAGKDEDPAGVVATTARRWSAAVLAGHRWSRLRSSDFVFAEQAVDGDAPFGAAEVTFELERGGRAANGRPLPPCTLVRGELVLDASPASGGLDAFARAEAKLAGDYLIGAARGREMLLRVFASGGAASDSTPVAWWFRLGGDERMRGFEPGELAGRTFGHVGVEAGPTLGALLRRAAPSSPVSGEPLTPIDWRQLRVLLGAEYAWVDRPATLPPSDAPSRGWSFSITGEYAGRIPGLPAGARLGLGYGYAPESSHRSGRVFLTLRVPLSIPQPKESP